MKFTHKNVSISPTATIGKNVQIGDNTVIYDNVIIGDNSIICNDCVIGEPLNDYYYNQNFQNPITKIGANALIRSHTILYAGSDFGTHFQTGHRATIREYMKVGNHCSFGTLSDIQGYSKIGNYCRFHSHVFVAQHATIGNFVFLYPFVVLTDDPHPPSNISIGPTIADFAQIGAKSIILSNVSIGKNSLIGANSMVNKNIADELVAIGSPAKIHGSIHQIQSKEKAGLMHYPWPKNFERGMPWAGIGFDNWNAQNAAENA